MVSRLSNGISLARIVCIFWIFSVHYLQLPWFPHFTNGLHYDDAVNNIHLAWTTAANQATLLDGVFLWVSFFGYNGNFCFYILSGFSLWFSFKAKGQFSLGEFFEGRFIKLYIPYAVCVFISYYLSVGLLLHVPKEYDLYGLLIGGAGFNPDWRLYNSPLWFMSYLFILYLFFPFIVLIYKKFRAIGLAALFVIAFLSSRHGAFFVLNAYVYCFMWGILLMELIDTVIRRFSTSQSNRHAAYVAASMIILSGSGIVYYLYFKTTLNLEAPVFNSIGLAICVILFSVSTGMLFPTNSKFMRAHTLLSRGTLSVYLYHYLLVRVFTENTWLGSFDIFMQRLPHLFLNHISLMFMSIFLLMLIICALFQSFLDLYTGKVKNTLERALFSS
jgi:peptidoglycan/LPS O-acetylase OafA/YrhL